MTNIHELISRQALAVKSGSNNASKVADLLRQAASLLEADAAPQPEKVDPAAIRKEKNDRIEKYNQAMKKSEREETHLLLTNAGWARGYNNEAKGESSYGLKAKPGYQLKVGKGRFWVENGTDVKIAPLELSNLKTFLQKDYLKNK